MTFKLDTVLEDGAPVPVVTVDDALAEPHTDENVRAALAAANLADPPPTRAEG